VKTSAEITGIWVKQHDEVESSCAYIDDKLLILTLSGTLHLRPKIVPYRELLSMPRACAYRSLPVVVLSLIT
jgi:hypothetical protein